MNKEIINKLIIFFLIPVSLLIFIFLVPPFQKPDEQPHFEKSLIISKGYLFCKKKFNNTVKLEKKYIDFIKNPYLDLLTHGKSSKLPLPVFFKDLFSVDRPGQKIDFNIDHLCSFPIISYLPQAFTLVIASLFKFNPFFSLYFGRLIMGILGYFWFLYLYRKIVDDYKPILLFAFALPMTLHQISSFSYDVLHIMFALTFFVLIINYRLKKRVDFWQHFKLFFVLFLFLGSKKIGYETFFLFLFLIPLKIKPMLILSSIFIPFYFLSKVTGAYDLHSAFSNQIIFPSQQLNFLLSNPFNFFIVIGSTTIHRIGFYLQSMIGIFGWLEYGLDPLSYFLYGLFFIYILMNFNLTKKYVLNKMKNFLLFGILFISYIYIILLAFVFNTQPGTLIAHGVQGRYFIPFLPFIILFIIQIKNNKIFQKILYYLIVMFLISATIYSVINRYY